MSFLCSYDLFFMLLFRIVVIVFVFFFFKQKTAYEMRISDWSSDVCSSDLAVPAWQRPLSKIVHFLFYALLILLPLSGWVWMSAADRPIDYFGLFELPSIVGPDKALADTMHERHELLGLTMLALVVIHILAALKHQFVDRSGVTARMNPF